MSKREIIRAWKDEAYRSSLSEEERAQLPENPAGAIELREDELANAAGGTVTCLFSPVVIGTYNNTEGKHFEQGCANATAQQNSPACSDATL